MTYLGKFKIFEKENPLINVYKWIRLNNHMWTTEVQRAESEMNTKVC